MGGVVTKSATRSIGFGEITIEATKNVLDINRKYIK